MLASPSAPPRVVVVVRGKVSHLDCSNKCTTSTSGGQGEQKGTNGHEWPYSLHPVLTLRVRILEGNSCSPRSAAPDSLGIGGTPTLKVKMGTRRSLRRHPIMCYRTCWLWRRLVQVPSF